MICRFDVSMTGSEMKPGRPLVKAVIITIVAVDGAFGMEKSAQRRVFGREAPWFHHDHAPVRYDKVAEAMGCHGEYVDKASDIRPALERARESGLPSLINVHIAETMRMSSNYSQ